ncbi:MAG: LuxR C-terminal-related transcriptional regulator [Succinivibrionaceae bacterium]|nr:LuxR C-terminal-related transcriptional regulator [Succinivibrionaceae bacterium]
MRPSPPGCPPAARGAILLCLYALTFMGIQNTFSLICMIPLIEGPSLPVSARLLQILAYCLFISLGMLAFALWYARLGAPAQRAALAATIAAGLAMGAFYRVPFADYPVLHLTMLLGHAGAQGMLSALALSLALQYVKRPRLPMFIASAMALGVSLTIALGLLMDRLGDVVIEAFSCLCQILEAACFLALRHDLTLKDLSTSRRGKSSGQMRPYLMLCVAIVALLSFIHGLKDGSQYLALERLKAEYVHADFRILYIASLLIAGALFERLGGYRIMLALLSATMAWMCVYLFEFEEASAYSFALAEFSSGFFVIFVTCIFLNVANSTVAPLLVANAGRMIEYPTVITSAMSATLILERGTFLALLVTIILFFLLMTLMFRHTSSYQSAMRLSNALSLYEQERKGRAQAERRLEELRQEVEDLRERLQRTERAPLPPATPGQPAAAPAQGWEGFIAGHGITPKEQEVLWEVRSLAPIKDIARRLGISERTVKYRITQILKKTGARSQKDLLLLMGQGGTGAPPGAPGDTRPS